MHLSPRGLRLVSSGSGSAVVDSFVCFLLLPLWEYVFVLCLMYVTLCPFSFCNHLDGEERAGCVA